MGSNTKTTINNNIVINISNPSGSVPAHPRRRPSFSSERGVHGDTTIERVNN